jgi:hypothetical protein
MGEDQIAVLKIAWRRRAAATKGVHEAVSGRSRDASQGEWYELQTQLGKCVWLIAVFRTSDDTLESDGYGYACGRR